MAITKNGHHRSVGRTWSAWFAALLLGLTSAVAVPLVAQTAQADVPPIPVAAAFDAPTCENTTGNPSVDADGGPVTNLLSVFGGRLASYNAGNVVPLYNNSGRSGWTSSGSQYAGNPVCAVRYDAEAAGPVSAWTYCTFDRASVCSWTNANGDLERAGVVRPPWTPVAPDARLTEDQQKLQFYIVQNDLPVVAGPNGNGGTVPADTVANNATPASRTLRQNLVHCIDNPDRASGLVFCANNMSPATQARILAIVDADPADRLAATGPGTVLAPGTNGEIDVTTTLVGRPLTLTVTGGTVTVCGGPATLTGNTLVVDEDAPVPAEITLCATRPDDGTVSVALSGTPQAVEVAGLAQSGTGTLCQIFAVFDTVQPAALLADADVQFGTAAVPEIGTTLLDDLDGDRYLVQSGGMVVDTVAYSGLQPTTEYTVSGELMVQATGAATGIVGSTVFTTDATGSGTVEVEFTIPATYAGQALTAFEVLTLAGTDVASHTDLDDQAQTVYVADLGTTLVDAADGDKVITAAGGVVTDTVAYTNLAPNTAYSVAGELYDKADGSATGITGTAAFVSSATGNGTVDVDFTIPAGFAGTTLVAFEILTQGQLVVAEHADIDDTAQTVVVGNVPLIGTTLVDDLDGDQYIVQSGGTVVDTVSYTNLEPETEYTVAGELMDQATGTPTGITGETTFTSSATGTGTVQVEFVIDDQWAGRALTAFEVVSQDGVEVASHTDINDEAQTVYVADLATTLLDEADGDSNVTSTGGTVIDTVAYVNLAPSTEYLVSGELIDQSTGTGTGIVGSTTFTSSATGTGTVEVEFTISADWAGSTLVAFEFLTRGGLEVAEHADLDDAAQTVTVAETPLIGTTLVDDLDGDRYIAQAGGTVVDTVSYENLEPETEYTVSGELIDRDTGTPTGIVGSTTFVSSGTGTGTVEVLFVISADWAGHTLTAFEVVTQGDVEIAAHTDLDDDAQTVYVADLGTTLVDSADGDRNVAAAGGTVIDTVAYVNLAPETEYLVSGELIDRATGTGTGLLGSTTFLSSATGTGTVEVEFTITSAWAGHTLVAFEIVTQGGLEVAAHADLDDAAQTVVVDSPTTTTPTTSTDASPTSDTVTPTTGTTPTSSTGATSTGSTSSTGGAVGPTSGTTSGPGWTTTYPGLAHTGVSSQTVPLAVAGLIVLLLGAALVLTGRRRGTRAH